MTSKQFYECLFNEEEVTCFGEDKYATKTYKAITTGIKEDNALFTINPHKKGSTRNDDNVIAYRNFLFEIDEYEPDVKGEKGEKVPKEIQAQIVYKSGLPFSTSVWSGGKSFHWILSLADDTYIESKVEYEALWKAVTSILNNTANQIGAKPLKFDRSTKNPSRLSRSANAIRLHETGPKLQKLAKVNGRITINQLENWLESNGVNWYDYMPKPNTYTGTNEYNLSASQQEKVDFVLKYRMQNMVYESGKEVWQYTFARQLKNTGLTLHEIETAIINQCGVIDTRLKPQLPAICDPNGKYSNDEKIYVWSKEDKRRWAEEQAALERARIKAKENQKLEANPEYVSEQIHVNGLDNYIRVGTKYFYIAPTSLIPWNADTIKTDFGPQALRSFRDDQKYTGFCNNISYTENITRIGTEYNMFSRPQWPVPVEGDWPLTERLIRKVFSDVGEDHYELGLDYIQLILTKPQQMVRALILGSKSREAGKDTFGDFMEMLVGSKNYNMIDVEEFLDQYNDQYAPKHIIFINEVELDKFNQSAKNKLKNYVTQKTVVLNGKYMSKETINYYGRLIMATNNIDDFMGIDNEENRFWIRILPPLLAEDKDPLFLEKLKLEIPHFLHFILNRKLHQETKLGRFWHSEEQCNTSALQHIKNNSRTNLYYQLEEEFEFILDNHVDRDHFYFTAMTLRDHLSIKDKSITVAKVRKCLEKEFRLEQLEKRRRYDYFSETETNSRHYKWCSKTFGTGGLMSEETERLLG